MRRTTCCLTPSRYLTSMGESGPWEKGARERGQEKGAKRKGPGSQFHGDLSTLSLSSLRCHRLFRSASRSGLASLPRRRFDAGKEARVPHVKMGSGKLGAG